MTMIRVVVVLMIFSLRAWAQAGPTLTLASPSNETVVQPGQNVTVEVRGLNLPADGQEAVIGDDPIGISQSQSAGTDLTFQLTVPNDIQPGTYSVWAAMTSSTGITLSPSVVVKILPNYQLDALGFDKGMLVLAGPGRQSVLSTFGSSGGQRQILDNEFLSFTSADPAIATVDASGVVTAAAAGKTTVSAAYGTASGSITVLVGNAVIAPPVTATPTFSPAPGSFNGTLSATISDATPGSTIYYTVNGTTPTTSSTQYSAPLSISTTETLEAIAAANGYTQSAVASATYTISAPQQPPGPPTFNPPAGSFNSAQVVTMSDATIGANIYYTIDGSTPTASSMVYTAPIPVASTETLKAIAVLGGSSSPIASATYTINSPGLQCQTIDYSKGFSASGLSLNGGATITNNLLQLTDGKFNEARSAFYSTAVPVTSFTTDFTFQLRLPVADGITFTIQSNNPQALGGGGGGLGYAGIPNSVAVKFDLFNNEGEGYDSTGLYFNGAFPGTPAASLFPAGIHLHSGHIFAVHVAYANKMAKATITDTVTSQSASVSLPGDLSTIVGDTAYVGFTGGTGSLIAVQNILTWSFSGGADCATQ